LKLVQPHEGDPRIAPTSEGTSTFDGLYNLHFSFVWRCLRGLGVPTANLDDATQDVFLAVHRQLPTFRGDAEIRTWVYGITRHVAANHRRRHRRKSAVLEPLQTEHGDPRPDPWEHAAGVEAASFVEQFLSTLDTKEREVFLLALMEEMTIPEVAGALSIPLNTAYTRLRRVKAKFQSAWEHRSHA